MENLDFGWEFGVMIMAIMAFIYFLIAFANYSVMLLLLTAVKWLVKATIRKIEKLSILHFIGILLPIVLISQLFIGKMVISFVTNAGGQINFSSLPGGILFWETYFFYSNDWILFT